MEFPVCGYCGCDSIEVIGRFMAEHVEIINANGLLRAAVSSGGVEALEAARSVVAGLLWPHTVAEEAGLFRVLARDEVYASHVATLCEEHATLAVHLAAITPGDAVAMTRFENELRDHIDKEDNGLFPAAAIALDGPEWIEVHETTPHSHDGPPSDGTAPHVHDHPSGHSREDDPAATGRPHSPAH